MSVELKTFNSREEWLKSRWRIGGSDAAAVVGMSPYKNNVDLWKEKTGQTVPEDISDKPYVKYGIYAEEYLRHLFSLDYPQYSVEYVENNMFLNDKYPFAHASLDGWLIDQDGRNGVLEIKTTNIMSSSQNGKWKGQIPDNYYVQVLHNMMVTEFDFCVLKAQLKYDYGGEVELRTRHYTIERSEVEEYIQFLAEKEAEFWTSVTEKRQPALMLPEI